MLGSGHPERQALVYADATNPQSLNKYQYCFNNPLRFTDPDGQNPQDGYELRLRRDEKALLERRMTPEEFNVRRRAEGVGGVVRAVAIGVILAGRQATIPILIWSARNPDKVQSAAYALQELMGGSPGVVTGLSRMTKAEVSMAEYLAARGHAVEKLAEVAQAGVKNPDFLVNGVKVELKSLGADALGSTLKNRIAEAVGQGGGNVLIDARAATAITRAEAEKAAARVFGADSRLNVVRIVGQDFDITIARQAQ